MPWDPLNAAPKARPWLWLGLAILVGAMQGPAFVGSLRPDRSEGVDFFQEWAAARNLLNGLPVYGPLAPSVERYLGWHIREGEQFTFATATHPPVAVMLAIPFAYLDYPNAVLAWNLVSLVALAVSLTITMRQLGIGFAPWSLLPVVTLLLLCGPLRHQIAQGQLNLVLLVLLTGAWAAERSGRPAWAGALLGLAAAIKVFPAFLFLYLILRRQWRALLAGVAVILLAGLLSLAVLGPETSRSYISDVLPSLNEFRGYWNNVSLTGFVTKLFDPPIVAVPQAGATGNDLVGDAMPVFRTEPLWRAPAAARVGSVLSSVCVLALMAWVVWRSRTRPQVDLAFGLSVTAMLLISPITWDHYLLLLLVPWALVWVRVPRSATVRALFLACSAALWVLPSEVWRIAIPATQIDGRLVWDVATPWQTLTVLSLQCYALVILFGFLLVMWQMSRVGPASTTDANQAAVWEHKRATLLAD
jgi:hypothetical protein